jgi:hypothetical protein
VGCGDSRSRKARLTTSSEQIEAKSRLIGIRLAMLTLRFRDNWIGLFGDHETALIALAIIVIASERLTRSPLDDERESLAVPMRAEDLARCNISSIAAATGMNRETTRRKVDQLVKSGLVVREGGVVRLKSGFTQQSAVAKVVKLQLNEVRRAVNDLLRMEAIELR